MTSATLCRHARDGNQGQLISLPRYLVKAGIPVTVRKPILTGQLRSVLKLCHIGQVSNFTASRGSKYFINGTSCFRGNLFCYNKNDTDSCQTLIEQFFRAPPPFLNITIIVFILQGFRDKCNFLPWHVLFSELNVPKLRLCNSNSYAAHIKDCQSEIYTTMEMRYKQ